MARITRRISERVHMGALTFDKQHGMVPAYFDT